MKAIKTTANNKMTIKDIFNIGDKVTWTTSWFDGRVTEFTKHSGRIVKVNNKTVNVATPAGNVVKLRAFKNITTKEWMVGE